MASRAAVINLDLTWLEGSAPDLVRDYLVPPPAVRAEQFALLLQRCAASGTVIRIGDALVAGVEPLDWDSRHFGLRCARFSPLCVRSSLSYDARLAVVEQAIDAALVWAAENQVQMLVRRMPGARADEARLFETRGFRLMDTLLTLTARPSRVSLSAPVREAVVGDRLAALEILRDAFPFSRFLVDPALNAQAAGAVYAHWLDCLLNGQTREGESESDAKIFIAEAQGRPGGVLAIRRDQQLQSFSSRPAAAIEMFAVAGHARKLGLGAALLAAAGNWAAAEGLELIEASTWAAASAARRAYARAHYAIRDLLLTFHWHAA